MANPSVPGTNRGAAVMLAFDTTGSACSVAVSHNNNVLAQERREMRHGHAENLLPMIDRVMARAGLLPTAIDTIVVSVGPGGFTGIRAGLAAAHGLALASDARLLGVTSFAAVAAPLPISDIDSKILVALDSRRTDLYVQLFDRGGAVLSAPAAVSLEQLAIWVGVGEIIVAGDAATAAAAVLEKDRRIHVLANSAADACGLLAAMRRWPERADPAARPLYLRPPDVSFPKPSRSSR
jgi:tRNA threonylcarbamoyladenosine biosynthesis protein TsaB